MQNENVPCSSTQASTSNASARNLNVNLQWLQNILRSASAPLPVTSSAQKSSSLPAAKEDMDMTDDDDHEDKQNSLMHNVEPAGSSDVAMADGTSDPCQQTAPPDVDNMDLDNETPQARVEGTAADTAMSDAEDHNDISEDTSPMDVDHPKSGDATAASSATQNAGSPTESSDNLVTSKPSIPIVPIQQPQGEASRSVDHLRLPGLFPGNSVSGPSLGVDEPVPNPSRLVNKPKTARSPLSKVVDSDSALDTSEDLRFTPLTPNRGDSSTRRRRRGDKEKSPVTDAPVPQPEISEEDKEQLAKKHVTTLEELSEKYASLSASSYYSKEWAKEKQKILDQIHKDEHAGKVPSGTWRQINRSSGPARAQEAMKEPPESSQKAHSSIYVSTSNSVRACHELAGYSGGG